MFITDGLLDFMTISQHNKKSLNNPKICELKKNVHFFSLTFAQNDIKFEVHATCGAHLLYEHEIGFSCWVSLFP